MVTVVMPDHVMMAVVHRVVADVMHRPVMAVVVHRRGEGRSGAQQGDGDRGRNESADHGISS